MSSVRDESSNRDKIISNAIAVIGKSKDRLNFFKAVYFGPKPVKDQDTIRKSANLLSNKRVLEIGKKFVAEGIMKQDKLDNKTAYKKIPFYTHNKTKIIKETEKIQKKSTSKSTKRNNVQSVKTLKTKTRSSIIKKSETIMKDVFICHASEDKKTVAKPLSKHLNDNDIDVWYDDYELEWGDSLMESIDKGLKNSKFGIVVLSRAFFKKEWPQRELRGMYNLSIKTGKKKILPLLYNITIDDLASYSPLLSDLLCKKWDEGLDSITDSIKSLLKKY